MGRAFLLALLALACNSVTRSHAPTRQAPSAISSARNTNAPASAKPPAPSADVGKPLLPEHPAAEATPPDAPAEPGCTLEASAPSGPEEEALFVLVSDEQQSATTYWLERKGHTTHRLGWSPNAIFAWDGGVWKARTEHHESKTAGCSMDPDAPPEPGTATLEHLVLERLDAPGRLEPFGPAHVPNGGVREASSSGALIGLCGPYVFLRRDDFEDGCGAHGNSAVTLSVFNLATQQSPKFSPAPTLRAKALKLAREYQKEMQESGPLDAHWEGTLPTFTGSKLVANFVFVISTNYAASDWGSYQHAIWVEGAAPRQLLNVAKVPSLLAALKCDSSRIVGFSQAPPNAATTEAVRRAFRSEL